MKQERWGPHARMGHGSGGVKERVEGLSIKARVGVGARGPHHYHGWPQTPRGSCSPSAGFRPLQARRGDPGPSRQDLGAVSLQPRMVSSPARSFPRTHLYLNPRLPEAWLLVFLVPSGQVPSIPTLAVEPIYLNSSCGLSPFSSAQLPLFTGHLPLPATLLSPCPHLGIDRAGSPWLSWARRVPRHTPWVVMRAPGAGARARGCGGGSPGRPRRARRSPSCSSSSCSLRSASACTWRRRRRCSMLSSGAKARRRAAAAICCCTDTSRSRASRANSCRWARGWDRTQCQCWRGTRPGPKCEQSQPAQGQGLFWGGAHFSSRQSRLGEGLDRYASRE